ncbi:GntR family transcriptional regulator [Pseudoclavibacter terrae]|uniref:GntR family transcriptional regulator n=1 Tax=Pseudoclavibacter terrae TaxID=1530195 RepID=UPI00232F1071|nr:GntR family transcriptional regulator [Pseudoclavibacter terrae]
MSTEDPAVNRRATRLPSARDIAYSRISAKILSGEFVEGQLLDEVSLAEDAGTSRTPVREALNQLQAERYVDLVPRRGAQVRVITAVEMQEIYQTRLVLEADAITKTCARALGVSPVMQESLAPMVEASARGEWQTFATLDQQFHSALVRHAGNAVAAELYESLRPRHIRLAMKTASEAPWRMRYIQSEHNELVAALAGNDEQRALSTLRSHLKTVPELVEALSLRNESGTL